jgi:hypothetical protein
MRHRDARSYVSSAVRFVTIAKMHGVFAKIEIHLQPWEN